MKHLTTHSLATLLAIGFPNSAIRSLQIIADLNDRSYLIRKIDEELEHLILMRQLNHTTSVSEILDLLQR